MVKNNEKNIEKMEKKTKNFIYCFIDYSCYLYYLFMCIFSKGW